MTTLQEKMERIVAERDRLAAEEAAMREEAQAELDSINSEIEALEQRKEKLEAFLGLEDVTQRAGHGQILQLCLKIVSSKASGMTSAEVRETIEADYPGVRVSSVAGTLSRMVGQGRLRRDETGRYFAA